MLRQSVARAGQKPGIRSRCGIGNWRVAMRFFPPEIRWSGSGQATGGIGTAGREAASGVEWEMGVARRWCLLCVFSLRIMLLRFA